MTETSFLQKLTSIFSNGSALLLILLFLSGCGDSNESNLVWEQTKQTNTKDAYLAFVEKYPNHSKAEEARISSQDFLITLIERAPATLDTESNQGKMLTFVFVDVSAQWPNTVGEGKPENVVAAYEGNKRSPLIAVLHWSWEKVDIEMEGSMRRMNGGSFIHTEPLNEYPGHPLNFPSNEGWYNYHFKPGGKIRLGLFFEGVSEELESIRLFGQLVKSLNSSHDP